MRTSQPSSQTPADRRAAEAEVRSLIEKFAPERLRLINAVRRSVRKLLPSAHEIVYEYRDCFVISVAPSDRGYEGVLALRASEGALKLYFNFGKDLPDPEGLLEGDAKQVRWIDVPTAATLSRPAVAALIDAAIAHAPSPFASSGTGSVVVRTTAAKKRSGRRTR